MTIGKAGPRAGQTSRVSLTGDLVVQTSRIEDVEIRTQHFFAILAPVTAYLIYCNFCRLKFALTETILLVGHHKGGSMSIDITWPALLRVCWRSSQDVAQMTHILGWLISFRSSDMRDFLLSTSRLNWSLLGSMDQGE